MFNCLLINSAAEWLNLSDFISEPAILPGGPKNEAMGNYQR